MILRGINFGPVHQASGVTNFHGKGYWFHHLLRPCGLDFRGTTFVSKTTTLNARAGNMPLTRDGVTPREWKPRCIWINRAKKAALNAVSLSGPGLEALIQKGFWQKQRAPFFISVMSLEKTPSGRQAELQNIFLRLSAARRFEKWCAPWGIQINFSCPNGGLDPQSLIEETVPLLEMAKEILPPDIPLVPKFGPDIHPSAVAALSKHCDALCVFNTLPFGKYPVWACETPPIDWKGLCGTDKPDESPIARRFPGFPGGLSGAPLLPFLLEWLRRVRALGVQIPLIAGGGIVSPYDTGHVFDAGADAIFLGSIAFLAPTKVRAAIRFAHLY
jgi:dihydroorotate dehydrogenase